MNDIDAFASMMGWWHEAGVDFLVDDAPRNWLQPPRAAAARSPSVTEGAASPVAREAPRPDAVPAEAPRLKLPDTLDALQTWVANDPAAPEARWGTPRIAPAGDPASGLMIVTDLPDDDDAAEGRLLGGAAGRLFDRMLAAIGHDRASIYLASLASARPVGGRIDGANLEKLGHILGHHVQMARPKRLLLLGDAPNRALLGMGFLAARGSLRTINHGGIKVEAVASFHPRQLLKQPALKGEAWRDLLLLNGGPGQ
ncbi:DNA polymerase [Sphingomonas zeicaulis]|uniref:uracil-DNA glycosylase n=1 Tax=Sphingomonas zeicaulis TaxID=1632740 RepID=UPI003D1A1829